jgi:Zn-dependent M16 (insulinase) family peptidase
MTDEDLELAIIGTIGDMDTPMSPSQRGGVSLQHWMMNESAPTRQNWRDQVIGTTREDIIAFGQRLAEMTAGDTLEVVIGSQSAFEKANEGGTRFAVQQVV